MVVDGTWSKMLIVNAFVPDSLIACQTPLLQGLGLATWINTAFVAGDLNVNGLAGNASSKFLNTGFPSNAFASSTSTAVVQYNATVTASGFGFGGYTTGGNGIMGAAKHTDNKYYSYNGVIATNVISGASPGAGYYCRSRVSATDHRIYFANSTNPHAQLGATDSTSFSSTLSAQNMYSNGENDSGALQFPCSDKISFLAFAVGLTSADSSNIFNRVQAFRQALGGGFV